MLLLLHKPLLLKNMGNLNSFYYKNVYLKPRLQKHFPILINSIIVIMISISGWPEILKIIWYVPVIGVNISVRYSTAAKWGIMRSSSCFAIGPAVPQMWVTYCTLGHQTDNQISNHNRVLLHSNTAGRWIFTEIQSGFQEFFYFFLDPFADVRRWCSYLNSFTQMMSHDVVMKNSCAPILIMAKQKKKFLDHNGSQRLRLKGWEHSLMCKLKSFVAEANCCLSIRVSLIRAASLHPWQHESTACSLTIFSSRWCVSRFERIASLAKIKNNVSDIFLS